MDIKIESTPEDRKTESPTGNTGMEPGVQQAPPAEPPQESTDEAALLDVPTMDRNPEPESSEPPTEEAPEGKKDETNDEKGDIAGEKVSIDVTIAEEHAANDATTPSSSTPQKKKPRKSKSFWYYLTHFFTGKRKEDEPVAEERQSDGAGQKDVETDREESFQSQDKSAVVHGEEPQVLEAMKHAEEESECAKEQGMT